MTDEPAFLPMAPPEQGPAPLFERVAVIGLGLVGGSIALAARERWPRALVIGVDRGEVLEQAIRRHAIDVASEEPMIVSEANLVILAAPVASNVELLGVLADLVPGDAIVTDVGSTKRTVLEAARALPPRLPFVGGHPLAGAARSGIEFARPDLFQGRPWLLTPPGDQHGEALARVMTFVEALGARPHLLPSAAAHDHLVALLSHLPQLTASALMQVVGDGVGDEGLALSGRGLADTTRLASSPPAIWRDICATNDDEIAAAIDALMAVLQQLRDGLKGGEAIDRVFESAARWRERLSAAIGPPSP